MFISFLICFFILPLLICFFILSLSEFLETLSCRISTSLRQPLRPFASGGVVRASDPLRERNARDIGARVPDHEISPVEDQNRILAHPQIHSSRMLKQGKAYHPPEVRAGSA